MTPESAALQAAASQGLFAILFVSLLFYVLREHAKREAEWLRAMDKLADAVAGLTDKQATSNQAISELLRIVQDLRNERGEHVPTTTNRR